MFYCFGSFQFWSISEFPVRQNKRTWIFKILEIPFVLEHIGLSSVVFRAEHASHGARRASTTAHLATRSGYTCLLTCSYSQLGLESVRMDGWKQGKKALSRACFDPTRMFRIAHVPTVGRTKTSRRASGPTSAVTRKRIRPSWGLLCACGRRTTRRCGQRVCTPPHPGPWHAPRLGSVRWQG